MKNCTKCNEIIISNKSKDICINCIREEKNIITILKTKKYKNKSYNDEEIDIIIKNLRNYATLKNYIKEFEIKKYEKVGVTCNNNCENFPCIKCKKLSNEEILTLYNSGDIKFTERYETKFKTKYTPL